MLTAPASYLATATLIAVLSAAVWVDMREHRIPNLVSLGGILAGLCMHTWFYGLEGLLSGLGGMAVGLGVLLPFYIFKGMGAGDVKLMAAVGAFMGPHNVLLAVGLTLIGGSIAGIAILVYRKGLGQALQRYWFTFRSLVTAGVWLYNAPTEGEAAAIRFPYALAIALGSIAAVLYLNGFSAF
ncbi:MAG: A24 family peptidase [Gammaproteobacteria bacterium]|jgi:prepilin peptidase CpaA